MSFILAGAVMGLGDGLVAMADEQKKKAAEERDIKLKRAEYGSMANDPEATRSQRVTARAKLSALDGIGGEDGGQKGADGKSKATGLPSRSGERSAGREDPKKSTMKPTRESGAKSGLGKRPVSREEGTQTEAKREIERLASLSPEAYEAQRRRVADRLGWRLSAIDDRVKAVRDSRSDKIDTVPKGGKPPAGGDTATRPDPPPSLAPPDPPQATPAVPKDRAAPSGPGARSGPSAPSSPNAGASDAASVLNEARTAIRQGAPRDAVVARLRELGIDPKGL